MFDPLIHSSTEKQFFIYYSKSQKLDCTGIRRKSFCVDLICFTHKIIASFITMGFDFKFSKGVKVVENFPPSNMAL